MYQNINSSIIFKCAMNSFREMFSLARIFPLALMHTPPPTFCIQPPLYGHTLLYIFFPTPTFGNIFLTMSLQ